MDITIVFLCFKLMSLKQTRLKKAHKKNKNTTGHFAELIVFNQKKKLFERWLKIKANILLKRFRKEENGKNGKSVKQNQKEVVEM